VLGAEVERIADGDDVGGAGDGRLAAVQREGDEDQRGGDSGADEEAAGAAATRRRIARRRRANGIMRSYFVASRTSRQSAW
jgi:hypothetical protein